MNRVASLLAVVVTTSSALADIAGFDPSSFTYNQHDAQTPASVAAGSLNITNSSSGEVRSVWFNARQDITAFTASFTYRLATATPTGPRQGIAFVIQNSAAGTGWVCDGGFPTNVGYRGLDHSAAVTLEADTGPGASFSGFYTGGAAGGSSPVTGLVNAFYTDLDVTIAYSGSLLTVTMADGVHPAYVQNYLVGPLAPTIGSPTAWIGFVASTGGGANQYISNFLFTAAPTPGAACLLAFGGLTAMRRRR